MCHQTDFLLFIAAPVQGNRTMYIQLEEQEAEGRKQLYAL
jgi:hypothetical protein